MVKLNWYTTMHRISFILKTMMIKMLDEAGRFIRNPIYCSMNRLVSFHNYPKEQSQKN